MVVRCGEEGLFHNLPTEYLSFIGPVLWACEQPVTFTGISSCITSQPLAHQIRQESQETVLRRMFFPHDSGQGSGKSSCPWRVALCYRAKLWEYFTRITIPLPCQSHKGIFLKYSQQEPGGIPGRRVGVPLNLQSPGVLQSDSNPRSASSNLS